MGENAFRRIQYGKETVRGTAVAATTMALAAPIQVNPDRKPRYPVDSNGLRVQTSRSQIYEYLVKNSLAFNNDHPGYFQILPLIFGCGLKGGVIPSEVTPAQGDYLWNMTPSLTAANTPDAFTLEVGDDVQEYECEHTMFERIRVSGSIGQDGGDAAVSIGGDYFARQWTLSAFTPALAIPTTEIMNAKLARFYLNAAWASVGTTEKTGLLRAFDIEILTGLHPIFSGSANKYFDTYGEGNISYKANFTFEGNSDANAIFSAFNSQALQVVQLQILGGQIGTGTPHSLIIDLGGVWDAVVPLSSNDRGNNLYTAVLGEKYDPVGGKALQVKVTTNQSTY